MVFTGIRTSGTERTRAQRVGRIAGGGLPRRILGIDPGLNRTGWA